MNDIDPSVAAIDLEPILNRLQSDHPEQWPNNILEQAALDYRRFLTLRKLYPGRDFVPTPELDDVWHAHILHTRQYARDMQAVFGEFLHHDPASGDMDEAMELGLAFEATARLYEVHFGAVMVSHARCSGKACHAPTPCRCR